MYNTYIYICVYIYMCIYIYTHIYTHKEPGVWRCSTTFCAAVVSSIFWISMPVPWVVFSVVFVCVCMCERVWVCVVFRVCVCVCVCVCVQHILCCSSELDYLNLISTPEQRHACWMYVRVYARAHAHVRMRVYVCVPVCVRVRMQVKVYLRVGVCGWISR